MPIRQNVFMKLSAIVFDFGNTIMREDTCNDPYLENCPTELMPGVREAIETIQLPKAIWANTRAATAADIRRWLTRANLDHRISWVVTSFELGYRKPSPEFFAQALSACRLSRSEILFVGNQ